MSYKMPRLDQPDITDNTSQELYLPVVQIDEHPFGNPPPDDSNAILASILGIPDPDEETAPAPKPRSN